MDIFRAQIEVGLLERLPVAAYLQHVPAVGEQIGIAAGNRGDFHCLASREVKDTCIGGFKDRIAELLYAWRSLFPGPAGDKIEPLDGRPVRPCADRRQRAEVRQLVDCRVRIERQVAQCAEVTVPPRDRQIDVRARTSKRSGKIV